MILAELPAYADEFEFEDFESDINYSFKNYLYKKVFVEGKDLGWQNLSGEKTFILKKTDQIWRELTPRSADFSFKIEDTNDDHVFQAICSHHDSPTGEKFTLYISEEK
tara:strand:- start:215 stop:538 length:324 start_codon:yes stop_codon:yes gene_type:complete